MRSPFEQGYAQRYPERFLDQRNIFAHQLFLQRDRPRREHDLFPASNGRNEIGQRLTDAGTGLDDRVHTFHDPALDELRHLQLPRARLESVQRPRERAALAEDLFERDDHCRRGCGSAGDSYSVSSACPVAASTTTGATRRGGA